MIDTTGAARYVERMISIDEARQIIADRVAPLRPIERELRDACGCVLREAAVADDFYPPVDRSMMDGYAIVADDDSERFRVVAEVAAGAEPQVALQRGECARVFTGATLPPGASQVLMQEGVRREGEWMIPVQRNARRFVRQRGQEAKPGDELLAAGEVLGAAELAILAQIGITTPRVSPAPVVAHIATGDELVDPAGVPSAGMIRDTNSILVRALVEQCGGSTMAQERCGDDLAKIVAFSSEHSPDVLLISGGASVGERDFGARALRELGYTIHFDRVNLRPGKPLTFATRDGRAAFVIPGNPVSHFVCFHVAIRLVLERMQHVAPAWDFVDVLLGGASPLRGDSRETFWPARVVVREGRLLALPQRWTSSGDTFSLAGTNALLRVKQDVEPGAAVPTLLLDAPR